jgi:acyl carrier protein
MDVIDDVIAEIVRDVAEVDAGELGHDVPFDEADVDSLELIEIAVEVERRFAVRFEDGELRAVRTIGDLADLVRVARAKVA